MQRIRLVLPYLRENGWEPVVLAIDAKNVAAPKDPWLGITVPADVSIIRVQAMSLHWGKLPGLGSLTGRALRALKKAGDKILEELKFDFVYFSTTQFGVHVLGSRWLRRYGVPFAMDYQDPWVNDYYRLNPQINPPGGRLKYALADHLNRFLEPKVLRNCSGITAVSSAYIDELRRRYPWLPTNLPTKTVTFPADPRDFALVEETKVSQSVFAPDDGFIHWVYVGRGGADMKKSAKALFAAIAESRDHQEWINRLKIHFIGTSYAAAGKGESSFNQLADQAGIRDLVVEITDRLPYSQSLRCLLDADALFIVGSDDSSYTASKLYPYLLAKKPLLGIFHRQSSAAHFLKKTNGGISITFDSETEASSLSEQIRANWIDSPNHHTPAAINKMHFADNLAKTQAAELAVFWARCLHAKNSDSS